MPEGGFCYTNTIVSVTLTQYKVSEKTNEQIPRKLLERTTNRWKDNRGSEGQTLIHRTLPAIARGPTTLPRQPYLNTENTIEAAMKLYVGHTEKTISNSLLYTGPDKFNICMH